MKSCFDYFKEICEIPRGSGNEETISNYVCDYAKALNLEYIQDEHYNVIVKKPATPNAKRTEPIILQGHLDMVCEKLSSSKHNFMTDAIPYYVEDGVMRAHGTTLGADNGIAISYMLKLLASMNLIHPDLECVFTTEEETGLYGAKALSMEHLNGKQMINLDAGPEGCMLIGSAGGGGVKMSGKVGWEALVGNAFKFTISGLQGGHSGDEIDKEHANAIILAGRLLNELMKEDKVHLISFDAGSKDNAIPRECEFIIATNSSDLSDFCTKWESVFKSEYQATEPDLSLEVQAVGGYKQMMDLQTTMQLFNFIRLCPNGVMKKNLSFNQLVETSLNLAIIHCNEEKVEIHISVRSSMKSQLDDLLERLVLLATVVGYEYELTDTYPAWEYQVGSQLQEICASVYKRQTGKDMEVMAVHGGLECGIFKEKIPQLDIVALGCNAGGLHTPQEWLELESFERVYDYLTDVLKELAN